MPDALTSEETNHVVKEGEIQFKLDSLEGTHQGDNAERSSKIAWLYDSTTTHLLEEVIHSANVDAGWVLDLIRPEAVQYAVYEEGDEYGFHTDGNQDRYAAKHLVEKSTDPMPLNQTPNPLLAGLVRKLSVTVNLSSPEDYEGGALELLFDGAHHVFPNPPYGSAIIFPSFISHRITPVTKGTRKSAAVSYTHLTLPTILRV